MHIHPFDTPHDAYIHSLGGVIYSGSLYHATSLEFAPLSPPVTDSHPLLSTPLSDDHSPCPLPLKQNKTTTTKNENDDVDIYETDDHHHCVVPTLDPISALGFFHQHLSPSHIKPITAIPSTTTSTTFLKKITNQSQSPRTNSRSYPSRKRSQSLHQHSLGSTCTTTS